MLLKLVPDNTNIGFLKLRFIALIFSIIIIGGSILLVGARGLNLGIDFVGGIMVEAQFEKAPDLNALRPELNTLNLGDVAIQEFGDAQTVSIRIPIQEGPEEAQQAAVAKVRGLLESLPDNDVDFRRVETVGGKVSKDLTRAGILSIALAMVAIAAYIWVRFEWQFGVGALVALIHDVFITLGFFAFTQLEFNLSIVAAVLTIVGYSLNDTIVVYDRVRENLRKYRKMDMATLLDLTVNETLARTVMTSLTVALPLVALIIWGGDVIFGFSVAMLLGIVVGTYSSIYIAAPLLLWMGVGPNSFIDKDETEDRP
jgi:preprotein translocase subunit SecF